MIGEPMTKAERTELGKLARLRERVAKTDAAHRASELKADFERQLASLYSFDDDAVWKVAYEAAARVVADAAETVAARCEDLGIPKAFAPTLDVHWYRRGENAVKERQQELRRVAYSRIEQLEKNAKHEISKQSLAVQTKLVAAGLTTGEARAFLEQMPTAAELMPALDATEIERVARKTLTP